MKIIILVILALIVSSNLISQNITETASPQPSGSMSVGRRLIELVDSSRVDPVDSAGLRVIPVWVWYPVKKSDKITPSYPLPDTWRNELGKYLDKKIGSSASKFLLNLKVWSIPDAPVKSTGEKYPVLLFGPGHTWLPTDYSTIIEDIVSYGYVVIGYVPSGFSGITQLSDGRLIPGTLSVHQQDILFDDVRFIRNNLYKLTAWMEGTADTLLLGIFGHSQGGAASTFLAGSDAAIKSLVNLDGDLMGSVLKTKLVQPALLLSNDERIGISAAVDKMDREGRERSEYRRHSDWVRATDDNKISLRIRINGIRHLNFNDLGLIPAGQMTEAERKDKLGTLDGAKSLSLISTITRLFFDFTLKNIPFPNLVELEDKYPDVQGILWKGVPYY